MMYRKCENAELKEIVVDGKEQQKYSAGLALGAAMCSNNFAIFKHALVYCIIDIQHNPLPIFPLYCVVVSQRCHRIASLLRLANEKIFCGLMLNINDTVH